MQTFSNDSPLNSVQNLPAIASESEDEFDLSPSNVVVGVYISNTLDILEKILDFRSGPYFWIRSELIWIWYDLIWIWYDISWFNISGS